MRIALTSFADCVLQKDPKKRPTALALQQHQFVLTAKKPVRGSVDENSREHD